MKIRPVAAELLHAEGRTEGHDVAISLFFGCSFCEST